MTRGTHRLDEPTIRHLVEQIVAARQRGIETILVTSGAIGAGIGQLGLAEKPRHIGDLQAVAAVGQNLLMRAYMTAFGEHDVTVAQLLITADDLSDRQRYVNFGNALHSLFRYGVVPIINENDTVSVDEIRVGDNDTLSAHVANAVGADLLVILTDTDGV
ncbi:MAG: glutamate 5-kinase, partial [Candidatus Poribacteria bacterium]|nr:glutamate 5-kinase [Candidatus Poribacteria bacterium]